MRFEWLFKNVPHVERHVPISVAEQVFYATDYKNLGTQKDNFTFKGKGTVDGVVYIVLFQQSKYEVEHTIYVITCYKARGRQKRNLK